MGPRQRLSSLLVHAHRGAGYHRLIQTQQAPLMHEILKTKGIKTPVVNIPGCPPNPYNFLSTVLYFLTFKKLPELDDQARPKFAYGRIIHENCERRPHFDAGRFAVQYGDEGHRKGYCLYKLGCKGPETFNNCPMQLFDDVGSGRWPVGTGHPCFGCSEKGVGFTMPLHSPARPKYITPPSLFTEVYPGKEGVLLGDKSPGCRRCRCGDRSCRSGI